MMTQAEYDVANHRRHELIEKKHSGFTDEESRRPFTVPGWREEVARREQANLTDAEREELERLQQVCGDWVNEKFPLPFDTFGERLAAIEARLGKGESDAKS